MRNGILSLLSMLIFTGLYAQDKTLWVDYVFSGTDKSVEISLDEMSCHDGWAGRRVNLDEVPLFEVDEVERVLTPSTKSFSVKTVINKNLQDFYRDYAKCDVVLHYKAPMSEDLRKQLYDALKKEIAGKSQKDAANILINFVQTAFEYKTDGDQFGYEKPFFLDETFYYPFCDCEDRAMLFSTLVRDLMGLETVLLDYPKHIASAVRFTEDIKGDALEFKDGSVYLICDPTYIGATIGVCMPAFKQVAPEIIR